MRFSRIFINTRVPPISFLRNETPAYTIQIQETIQLSRELSLSLSVDVSRGTTGDRWKTARRRIEIRFNGNANEWDSSDTRVLYGDRFVSE